MSLAEKSHPAHRPPTGQLQLFSHTLHDTPLPVFLPGHEEDPTSLSALNHYEDEKSDSQGQRGALCSTGERGMVRTGLTIHSYTFIGGGGVGDAGEAAAS